MDSIECPRCHHRAPVEKRVPARRGFQCAQCGAAWTAVPEPSQERVIEVHIAANRLTDELLQLGLQSQRSNRSRAGRPVLRVDFELGELVQPRAFLALIEHYARSGAVMAVEVDGQPLHPTDAQAVSNCRANCPQGAADGYCSGAAPGQPHRYFGCRRLSQYQRGDPHEKGWWRFQIPVAGDSVQIDKASLLQTLRREVRRMGSFVCPNYSEDRLRADVDALPDTLQPDGVKWFGQVGFRSRRKMMSGVRYRAPDARGALGERLARVCAQHGLELPVEKRAELAEELLALFAPPEASRFDFYAGFHELLRAAKESADWPELARFRFEGSHLWLDTPRGPVPFFEEDPAGASPDDEEDALKQRFRRLEM